MKIKSLSRGVALCALTLPLFVVAQEAQQDQEPVDCGIADNQDLPECVDLDNQALTDEIVVTGTYLKRDKFSSPSPVETITAIDIEESGAPSLGEYVRDLSFTVSSNTINNPGDSGSRFGGDVQDGSQTSINIRGFGTDGTLTLVDGMRAFSDTDVNNLMPQIMLERIEVQLDGGGATYGADAISGVVNLISAKKYDGVKFNVNQTRDDGGDYEDYRFSVLAGTSFAFPFTDQLYVTTALEHQNRSTLAVSERPQYAREARSLSDQSFPGTFSSDIVDPGCGSMPLGDAGDPGFAPAGVPTDSSGAEVSNVSEAATCSFGFDQYQDYLPSVENTVWNTNFLFEINDHIDFEYNLALSFRDNTTRTSPFTMGSADDVRFPASNPGVEDVIASGTQYITPDSYRPFGKIGTRPSVFNGDGSIDERTESYTYQHRIITNFDIGDTGWTGTVQGSTSAINAKQIQYRVRLSRLHAAASGLGGPNCSFDSDSLVGLSTSEVETAIAASGVTPGAGGCEYFNPLFSSVTSADPARQNSQSLVDWMVQKEDWDEVDTENRLWEARATGEMFDLPAGPVQLVAGHSYRQRVFDLAESPLTSIDDALNTAGINFYFSETVVAQFAELAVPVLDHDVIGSVDLSVAFRREEYKDRPFDPVKLPKYAVSYRPTDDLVFRASYGESFTAPRADELDESGETRYPVSVFSTIIDPLTATAGIPAPTGDLIISGNSGLLPETTENVNLGFTYRGIEDWEFSADVQEIQYFDRVVTLSAAELFGRQRAEYIEAGGDVTDAAEFIAFANANPSSEFGRDPVTGQVTDVYRRPSNAEDVNVRFVDLKVTNRTSTDNFGFFHTTLSATGYDEYLYVDEATLDGSQHDAVGKRNRDVSAARALPRWKGSFILRWSYNGHNISSRTVYTDGIKFDGDVRVGAIAPEKIDSFATTSLRYSRRFNGVYGGDLDFSVGVNNLLDEEAQPLPIRQGLESRLHDPIGRTMYLDLGYAF